MSVIVGIGELLWDVYPDGRKVAGGAPFNFAFHCHQLGHEGVIVSRVGVVYVIGAFKAQGAIPILQNSPLTLLQVAALSGGPSFEGDYSDLRIIRTTGSQRTLVQVDIKKVMYGKAPDPVLQADDVVFLPTSTLKGALKSGGLGTLFGIASLAITLIRQ